MHLDGKTMRHTRRDSTGLGALHVVSAWAGQAGLTLGQVAVDAKSNEITAMPQLLQLLDLRQKIVTTDAMGCQKEIAEIIVEQEGDFVLAVKENQPTLYAEIEAGFTRSKPSTSPQRTYTTEEKDHGRHECRTVRVLPAAKYLSELGGGCLVGRARPGDGDSGGDLSGHRRDEPGSELFYQQSTAQCSADRGRHSGPLEH